MGRLYPGRWTVLIKYDENEGKFAQGEPLPPQPAYHVTAADTYEEAEKIIHHLAIGAPVEYIRGVPTLTSGHHAQRALINRAPAAEAAYEPFPRVYKRVSPNITCRPSPATYALLLRLCPERCGVVGGYVLEGSDILETQVPEGGC